MKTDLTSQIVRSTSVTSGSHQQDVTASHSQEAVDTIEIKKVDVPQATEQRVPDSTEGLKKSQDATDIHQAIGKLDELVKNARRDIQFTLDDDSGRTIVKIVDSQTKEVLRQMPSEELLAMMKNMDKLKGVLFSDKV